MTAQQATVPVIYYFCDSTTTIIDLTYSLAAQLVRILPDDYHSQLDFTSTRFDPLDGTSGFIRHAIGLFKDLLPLGPYILFVIVDGLQMLDTASNRAFLQELVNVLHLAARKIFSDVHRFIKTLFTTDGFTDALMSLKGNERLDSMDFTGEAEGGPEVDGTDIGFL